MKPNIFNGFRNTAFKVPLDNVWKFVSPFSKQVLETVDRMLWIYLMFYPIRVDGFQISIQLRHDPTLYISIHVYS